MGRAYSTLLLNQGYQPVTVIHWHRAICLSFLGKVEVLGEHEARVHTVSTSYPIPAVVRLLKKTRCRPRGARFSRRNVYIRDRFTCQYCQRKFPERELTLDHVVPRSCGGSTEWTNIVAACVKCNGKKGGQSPEQVGWRLQKKPVRPPPSWVGQFGLEPLPAPWRPWLVGCQSV